MQNGARPIESSQLKSSQAWIQEKTNPSNLSPIQIRIPACTSVSIFGITFGSNIQDSS